MPYANWSEIGHVDCIAASLHHALLQCPPTLTLDWAIVAAVDSNKVETCLHVQESPLGPLLPLEKMPGLAC